MQDHGRWCVGAYIQAFTFSFQDHGRLLIVRISEHSPFCRRRHSQDHCRLTGEHISEHSLFRLKITVGCLTSTYPSIYVETLNIAVACPPCTYPSIHVEALRIMVGCLQSTETRGLWARPPVLSPVPSQAIHSRACLNLHHSDIQSTAQKTPCVNTFWRPSSRKKTETFLLLSGSLGRTHRTKTTDT